MRTIRLMGAEDVETAEDLMIFHRRARAVLVRLSFEMANVAWVTRAMLRRIDKVEGKNRRGGVARPASLAAVNLLVVARLSSTATVRLRNEYPQLFGARRTTTRRPVAEWHRRSA